jgi:hypothetical protein
MYLDTKKVGDLVSYHGCIGLIVEIIHEQGDPLFARIDWIRDYGIAVQEYEYCHNLKLESG